MSIKQLANLKGDLVGGMTAGMIPLPKGMALGALVFAPLGPEYMAFGILAGMISMAIANIVGAVSGSMPIMNNAPFSLSSFMLLAALNLILTRLGGNATSSGINEAAIVLLFLTVFLSGIFQVLFGLFRAGNLAKYIPYPVLAGLLNGCALLIMFSQVHVMLGLTQKVPLLELGNHLSEVQPLTLLVGVAVCLAIWLGPRINKHIPAPIHGIAAGVAFYYGLAIAGFRERLGPVIGDIPGTVPMPRYALDFFHLDLGRNTWPLVGDLAVIALGIAAVVSLRSLIVCTAGESLTQQRTNPNRELLGQGLSNAVASLFGGITTAASMPGTLANHKYGGRTHISRGATGIFALLVLLVLHPLIALLPKVALAGMLIMIALESFDNWSLSQLRRLPSALAQHDAPPVINGLSVIIVAATLIMFSIFTALAVGFAISIAFFIFRMSRSIVRREFSGDSVHSNTQRPAHEFLLLERDGKRIQGLELEGALFFGTADKVAAWVEELFQGGARSVILDFRRVADIDITGAKIIQQLIQKGEKTGVKVLLGALRNEDSKHRELVDLLGTKELAAHCFPDMEIAMAVAEDDLLDGELGAGRYDQVLALNQMDALLLLNTEDLGQVRSFFVSRTFNAGEPVIQQGDTGDSLFFIAAGRALVVHRFPDDRSQVFGTLCPGTVFGELSVLDERLRDADVIAEGRLVVYRLNHGDLQKISHLTPQAGLAILSGLGRELATRVRIGNRITANLKM